ncbi:putative phosphatidylcholine:ceramide cholinephosphotransferase 2 [Trypanosoma vivax]|uniref:Putative phosphatidylcholine:ceramide cholinephosphotransferase 2 n=1 Tax=Trypanosoma vivax (strain Y486) TaxID=1055687 RepID=G0U2S7_TRYVY|nr:putative phosphatidylcholine:ceramide cholinephosphotransferase 2 [Trypanosoma vivax]CCC50581.1 putative phosphatidylcholine:ceramide cholinephosphotransferase 2 [Trypanosoma vivax Y486]
MSRLELRSIQLRETVWKPLPLQTQCIRFTIVFLVVSFILAAALYVTHIRMPDPSKTAPLPDLGFEWTPEIPWTYLLTNASISILGVVTALVFTKMYFVHCRETGQLETQLSHPMRFVRRLCFSTWDDGQPWEFGKRNVHQIAWIRFVTTYMLLLSFRSVVIIMTSFPAPDMGCQKPPVIVHPLWNMILTVVTMGAGSIHCGDLMYSGHSIILSLHVLIHCIYGKMFFKWLPLFTITIALVGFVALVISRYHYTDDVLISIYLTVVTFIAIPHSQAGAPRSLQRIINWWPCCGSNVRDDDHDWLCPVIAEETLEIETNSVGMKSTESVSAHQWQK